MVIKSKKVSLSAAPFYASLLVILALAIFIGIFWTINEYQAHQESIVNIRQTYEEQYRIRVKEELENVVEFIDYTRNQTNVFTEEEIRDRVQSAYTIASHLYSVYNDQQSIEEIRSMVAEVLRPMRWYGGRGYYFTGQTKTKIIDLFADEPYFEGRVTLQLPENSSHDVIDDIIEIVIDKGAGTYRYNLVKPAFENQVFSKISFVKYFAPLDWFIGAGIYNNDMENLNQATALTRIKQMQFGQGGEIFVFRFDGTILSHKTEQLIGRSIRSLKNEKQAPYGETVWEISRGNGPGQGYATYMGTNPETKGLQQKLCYVQSYDDWGWVIVSSMYMNEMEDLITDATSRYRRISFRNVSTFIILFIMAVSLLLFVAYYYTVKIKQGFSLFTDFFRQAADSNLKIKTDALAFSEFEDLAQLANQMVEDRVQQEHLLRRDELRLDTLLRLGMMDSRSLKDKYNFTLQRIIQMTRSQEGYLALVNKRQSHVTIISHQTAGGTRVSYRNKRNVSRRVEQAGLPGQMISRKNAVICNNCGKSGNSDLYPYLNSVVRHLDVPVYNNGVIALVAGVCNNLDTYDNSDVRQVTMVMEGMWLHILKVRSEKKMARLERQIIAVREAERSNIGKILHDDLGSHLSGVELLSKALKRNLDKELPARAKQLEAIRALIVDATEKTRRLARGLYPVHVIENGLEAAIEELVVEIESLFGTSCELSVGGSVEFIDNTIATHIYYIIREAAFNAARHGKPENIGITMHSEKQRLSVKIIDDGEGFDIISIRKGMGLHTMEYRAKAIGATLTLQSNKPMGTIVTVSGEVADQ
ncbi:MAG: GAF domain-containing protein [Desulfobacterales bacterium]|nr:GAF domain-containing protein [Desulfobacterales bacterium]